MRGLLFGLLWAVGCGVEARAIDLPAPLFLSPGLSSAAKVAAVDAAGDWNDAMKVDVVASIEDQTDAQACGIHVRYAADGEAQFEGKRWADSEWSEVDCVYTVRLKRTVPAEYIRTVLAHELGHILKGSNAHGPLGSVMFERLTDQAREITAQDIADVRARL